MPKQEGKKDNLKGEKIKSLFESTEKKPSTKLQMNEMTSHLFAGVVRRKISDIKTSNLMRLKNDQKFEI